MSNSVLLGELGRDSNNRFLAGNLLIHVLLVSFLLSSNVKAEGPVVAVAPVSTTKGVSKQLGGVFAEILGQAVESLGEYRVVPASRLQDNDNYAEAASKLECDSVSCLAEAGRILKVDFVTKAVLKRAAGRFLLGIKLVDCHMWRLSGAISRVILSADQVAPMVATLFNKSLKLGGRFGKKKQAIGVGRMVETTIEANTRGAHAIVDGDKRVNLPATLRLMPGSHQLLVKAPRFKALATSIEVISGYIEQAFFLKMAPDEKALTSTRNTWFSVAAIGGNYGGGLQLSSVLLRWPYFYWQVVELEAALRDNMYGILSLGTSIGTTLFFGRRAGHELQIGLSAACTAFAYRGRTLKQDGKQITKERKSTSDPWQDTSSAPVSREIQPVDMFIGLSLGPKVMYSWIFSEKSNMALIAGVLARFPIPGAAIEFSYSIEGDEDTIEKGDLRKVDREYPDVSHERAGYWVGVFAGVSF
ncbi:MAG: PEGA domain-containing protein [Deltaproteobacteria bacterium]|nr:PEGA domain-containing protein [Deltaproteobacteria bacterium]